MYCKMQIRFNNIEEIEKYNINLFLNFPNNVINKNVIQYNVILIRPSPLPTPINKLYLLKKGDIKHEITFINQKIITNHCTLLSFICFIYSSFFFISPYITAIIHAIIYDVALNINVLYLHSKILKNPCFIYP